MTCLDLGNPFLACQFFRVTSAQLQYAASVFQGYIRFSKANDIGTLHFALKKLKTVALYL